MNKWSFVVVGSALLASCYHPEPYRVPPPEPEPAQTLPPATQVVPVAPAPLPPPAPPKPRWPSPPASLPTLEESAAAAPAWWKKQSDGTLVPPAPVAESLWARSADYQPGAVVGGIVCQLHSKVPSTDDHEVSRVRIEGAGAATVVADGPIVFLPGLSADGVRRIEVHHGRVHRMGVVDWIVGAVIIPLLPLLLNSEGYRPDGYVTGRVTGPPWKLSSKALDVECRPVERDDVEPLADDVLNRAEKCLTRDPNSEMPSDPEPTCVAPVAGLLGWADPRTLAVMARIDAEAALAKADRLKTHQRDLERAQTNFGDLEVLSSKLSCPAKGLCSIELAVVNRSISARSWFSHPWHARRNLIDANGGEFEIFFETSRDRIGPGAKVVFTSQLTPLGAATRPEGPLALRLESSVITAVGPEGVSCEFTAEHSQLTYTGPAAPALKFETLIDVATGDDRLGKAFGSDKYIVDLYGVKKCPALAHLERGKDGVLAIPSSPER